MIRIVELFGIFILIAMFVASPAYAGMIGPGVPGPVAGLGIPALIAAGLAYRHIRKRGNRG